MKETTIENAQPAVATFGEFTLQPGQSLVISADDATAILGSSAKYVVLAPDMIHAYGQPQETDFVACFNNALPVGYGMAGVVLCLWIVKMLRMAR